ncbi:MAG: MinD/ParA family protein [Aquabacterium sp.]
MTSTPTSAATRGARITAVTSGKGGVGKTFVSANLAACLARQGARVLVLDADLGLANLDVVLNLVARHTLHDVFTDKVPLREAIVPAPGGFDVLLAGSGLIEYSRLTPEVREQLLKVIDTVRPLYDHVILDTAAGISDVVLYTLSLADEILLVVTTEPTSLTDAYATIKVLATTQALRPLRLLVNQTGAAGQARGVRAQLQRVVDHFVNPTLPQPLRLKLVGDVPLDPAARQSIQTRQLLAEAQPGAPAAKAMAAAAVKLAE